MNDQTAVILYKRQIAYMAGFFHGAPDEYLFNGSLPHCLIHMAHSTFAGALPQVTHQHGVAQIIRDIRAHQAKG